MLEDSTMRRSTIGLMLALAFGMLWAPSPSLAQSVAKMPRIGILAPWTSDPRSPHSIFEPTFKESG